MKKLVILASVCFTITATSFITVPRNLEHAGQHNVMQINPAKVAVKSTGSEAEPRTYKTKLGNNKNNQVQIEVYRSSVRVVGHNSDEVIIQADDYNVPERAEGLRSLYSEVEDNTNMGLAAIKENNILKIVQASRRGGNYTIKVPKNVTVVYHESSPHGGKFELADTEGEINIDLHHASATLTNITGPVKANTLHGHLDIKFSQLNQAKASSINSVHGPVDITLPGNTKADLELQATHGEIYTDFDISRPNDSKNGLTKIAGGNNIKGKTNNGGVAMSISAVHSDIFIRKQK
jgi:hypothetical protein